MSNEFKFRLPDGTEVRTGNQVPETLPLSFSEYPDSDLLPLDQIAEIIRDPRRKTARDVFRDDWILNQGRRSSCNPYAVAGALSRIRHRMGMEPVQFGPEFLYALINRGRDQGSLLDEGMVAVTEHGICPREMIPYEAYRQQDVSMEARRVAKAYRAFECYRLPTSSLKKLWHSMVSAVCRNETIVLAVHVGNRFMATKEVAGVDRGPGNHAVGADDAIIQGNPTDVMSIQLDMFNSWGMSFGDRGRCLLTPRHVEEPMKYHAIYAVRSATGDPNADNPFVSA